MEELNRITEKDKEDRLIKYIRLVYNNFYTGECKDYKLMTELIDKNMKIQENKEYINNEIYKLYQLNKIEVSEERIRETIERIRRI